MSYKLPEQAEKDVQTALGLAQRGQVRRRGRRFAGSEADEARGSDGWRSSTNVEGGRASPTLRR
jgi:hypothetical protein